MNTGESDLGLSHTPEDYRQLRDAAATARAERRIDDADEIEAHLRKTTDHKGRARRLGDPTKNARDTVRERLKRAWTLLSSACPDLHEFLADRLHRADPYRIEVREGDPTWIVNQI